MRFTAHYPRVSPVRLRREDSGSQAGQHRHRTAPSQKALSLPSSPTTARRTRWIAFGAATTLIATLLVGAATFGGSMPADATGAAPATTTLATTTLAKDAANAVAFVYVPRHQTPSGRHDTVTGQFTGAGNYDQPYPTESVAKIFIATQLLLTGQMTGWAATTAYTMITQSDDASADALYGRVGGDSVITLIEKEYGIANLGSPPTRPGCWGCTQINAHGMVELYNDLRHDSRVWPWLSNAMHHAAAYGSDGTFQYFGIPSAAPGAAIKQGWGEDDAAQLPEFNSTGFVNGDQDAVVILTQGPGYGTPISSILTAEAQILMPGGGIRDDAQGPAAVSSGVNQIDTVSRGTDGNLWVDSYDPTGWSWREVKVPGTTGTAGAALVATGATRLDVFTRSSSGALIDIARVSGVWQPAVNLGGLLAGAPAAASPSAGVMDVFVRGTDNQLWEDSYNPTTMHWTWSLPITTLVYSDPTASSWGAGHVDVFTTNSTGSILHTSTNGGGWSAPENLGGRILGRASAVSWAVGRIDIFSRGIDGHLWQLFYVAGHGIGRNSVRQSRHRQRSARGQWAGSTSSPVGRPEASSTSGTREAGTVPSPLAVRSPETSTS